VVYSWNKGVNHKRKLSRQKEKLRKLEMKLRRQSGNAFIPKKQVVVSGMIRKSCVKRCHPSKGSADMHKQSLARDTGDIGVVSYFCDSCKAWHVGHNKKISTLE
jgi:hypothetical protein